ncbi:MAG: lipid-A-disaccharide synthase [Vicinamibacterales bacterium]
MPSIMVSCGEPSGDLYAGALARELRRLEPRVDIFGYGGPQLAEAGGELVGDYRGYSVTGLAEVIRLLPRTLSMLRTLARTARERRPDVLVLVDLPDFNFRLGQAVHRLGIPVVYYVGPQFWAWRPARLQTMKAFVRKALVIFPFEAPLYRAAGVDVEFVGHPLLDLARATRSRADVLGALGLSPDAPTVALLPGSRRNELLRILPTLVEALPLIRSRVADVQFVVARAPGLDDGLFAPLGGAGERVGIAEGETDSVLAASDVVVTASGTATVQTAIHGRPMVIVYRLSPLTYRLGKPFVNVDTYGMVNLVAGRRIARELIQESFTPAAVAEEAVGLLRDPERRARVEADLAGVVTSLGERGASARAARAVLALATERGPQSNVVGR